MNKKEFIKYLEDIYKKGGLSGSSLEDCIKEKLRNLKGFTVSDLKKIEENRIKKLRKLPMILTLRPTKEIKKLNKKSPEQIDRWIKSGEKEELDKFKYYDGVLIIPIQKDEPVFVFKKFGKPFYHLQEELDPYRDDFIEYEIFNYWVYWKGYYFKDKYPVIIKKQYDEDFWHLLHSETTYYNYGSLPKNVIEIPINEINNDKKMKIYSPDYITPLKNALRKLGLMEEVRGKFNRLTQSRKERNKEITSLYSQWEKRTRKKKPYPINFIYQNLSCDHKDISFATIRRVLDGYNRR